MRHVVAARGARLCVRLRGCWHHGAVTVLGDRRHLANLLGANGDTMAALGISLPDFQRDWFAFARQRYGL